jgi:acetylornithine deacetylase/succinyl-diaminopimelate desuccinylase-like protein
LSFIQCCRHLISLDTSPAGDVRAAVDYLAEVGKDLGFRADIQVESLGGVEQANLLLFPRGGPPRDKLMLQTHLDTVDPGIYSMWTKTAANPFNASIYNRELFGLGSADTKLDFLCKMFATGELCGRDLKRSFVLVGTYGAQSAMAGAIRLIRKRKVAVKYALVGEPTGLRLMGSGQGLAVVEVRVPFSAEERKYRLDHDTFESSSSQSKIFSGKAAHSTVPHLGESAIIKMFQFLENLPEGIAIMELDGGLNYNSIPANAYLEFDLVGGLRNSVVNKIMKIWSVVKELNEEFLKYKDEGFAYPYPSLNIGAIRTSEVGILITGSCRLLPSVSQEVYDRWISQLRLMCEKVGAEFILRDYKATFVAPSTSEFNSICHEALAAQGISGDFGKLSASTEASVFQRLGIECLVFGPGLSIGNSHAPNEFVSLDDLDVARGFYRGVVERFCL